MNWLAVQSPDHLEALVLFITQVQTQRNQAQSYVKGPMRKKPQSAIARRSRGPKGGVKPVETIGSKRPLNSWMAFRAYYSPIFTGCQQKDISGFMQRMWKEDPFHAKWAIAAKAYSYIRDKTTKSQAPVPPFLRIVCPLLGKTI